MIRHGVGGQTAGTLAALRAAHLGARTVLVTSSALGGMAANDFRFRFEPWLMPRADARSSAIGRYDIAVSEPVLVYPGCWRVRARSRTCVLTHQQIGSPGVPVHEKAGTGRFADPHTIITEAGLRLNLVNDSGTAL